MPHMDKQIKCVDCGIEFTFSVGEQERFAQLGFANEPRRCGPCRAARKAGRPAAAGPARELHSAVCAECGKPAQVPFRPRGDRPVYCSDCFGRRR